MLLRLGRDGALRSLRPWEMRTVRSLLDRGLVTSRAPDRTASGIWFLSAKGRRLSPGDLSDQDVTKTRPAPAKTAADAAEMPR